VVGIRLKCDAIAAYIYLVPHNAGKVSEIAAARSVVTSSKAARKYAR